MRKIVLLLLFLTTPSFAALDTNEGPNTKQKMFFDPTDVVSIEAVRNMSCSMFGNLQELPKKLDQCTYDRVGCKTISVWEVENAMEVFTSKTHACLKERILTHVKQPYPQMYNLGDFVAVGELYLRSIHALALVDTSKNHENTKRLLVGWRKFFQGDEFLSLRFLNINPDTTPFEYFIEEFSKHQVYKERVDDSPFPLVSLSLRRRRIQEQAFAHITELMALLYDVDQIIAGKNVDFSNIK